MPIKNPTFAAIDAQFIIAKDMRRRKACNWAEEYGFPETNIYKHDIMARMADNAEALATGLERKGPALIRAGGGPHR